MKKLLVLMFLIGCGSNHESGPVPPTETPKPVVIENCTMKTTNVLLIGDSVGRGFSPYVKAEFNTKYYITRIKGTPEEEAIKEENARWAGYTLSRLEMYLDQCPKWDLIIWNNGLWDVSSPEPDDPRAVYSTLPMYLSDMTQIAARLNTTGAAVVFLTSTPIAVNGPPKSPASPELVPVYNDAVVDMLKGFPEIQVGDLYSWAMKRTDLMSHDNLHWDYPGREYLAQFVIKIVRRNLE